MNIINDKLKNVLTWDRCKKKQIQTDWDCLHQETQRNVCIWGQVFNLRLSINDYIRNIMSCNSVVVDYNNNITTIPNNTCMFSKINSLHCWGDFGLSTYCRRVKRYFKHTVHHCYLEVHFPTIRRKPTLCPCLFFTLNQPGPRCALSLSLSISLPLSHSHTHTHSCDIPPHTKPDMKLVWAHMCCVCRYLSAPEPRPPHFPY